MPISNAATRRMNVCAPYKAYGLGMASSAPGAPRRWAVAERLERCQLYRTQFEPAYLSFRRCMTD